MESPDRVWRPGWYSQGQRADNLARAWQESIDDRGRIQAAVLRLAAVTDRGMRRVRLLSFALVVVTVVILVFAALEASVVLPAAFARPGVTLGMDYTIYMDRARSWLAEDGFYLPTQLNGPYALGSGLPPALYPPTLLVLLVPFTVLPAVLWWALPLAIIAASLWRLKPAMWAWPILAAILLLPRTWIALTYGNPSMWALAALTAGLAWAWPLAFVAVKPALAPFALLGLRRRAFWLGAAAFAVLSLPFGTMWFDYFTALTNLRNSYGIEYLFGEITIAAMLCVAKVASTRPPQAH